MNLGGTSKKKQYIAKLSFNFNFNLVESWDGFILNSQVVNLFI